MMIFSILSGSVWRALGAKLGWQGELYQKRLAWLRKPAKSAQTGNAETIPHHQAKWAPHTVSLPSWSQPK